MIEIIRRSLTGKRLTLQQSTQFTELLLSCLLRAGQHYRPPT